MKYEIEQKIREKLYEVEKEGSTDFYEGWAEALEWTLGELENSTVEIEPNDWIEIRRDMTVRGIPSSVLDKEKSKPEELIELGQVNVVIECHIKDMGTYDFLNELNDKIKKFIEKGDEIWKEST